jgi:hypothetical protein
MFLGWSWSAENGMMQRDEQAGAVSLPGAMEEQSLPAGASVTGQGCNHGGDTQTISTIVIAVAVLILLAALPSAVRDTF